MSRPTLSIGIIFKNEIRCLERCLKSLQPLRDAVPCELVMADTGSNDGSREVAEKYADILFDFPWINDFAAARNAVMDRSTGKWFFSIDADEWLDENIDHFVRMLRKGLRKEKAMALTVRNYDTYDLNRSYSDFVASRILRMSTGLRYEGAIHERWNFEGEATICFLSQTILHHDGYVFMDADKMMQKAERNMELLRKELAEDPDNLIIRLQYLESGKNEPNYLEVLRETLPLIEKKGTKWDMVGPPIYRYAVETACEQGLPELDSWVQRAEELFCDTLFIRIDVEYLMFCHVFKEKNMDEAIQRGERYLQAVHKDNNVKNVVQQMYSVVKFAAPFWQQHVKVLLAAAYAAKEKYERVPELLTGIDYTLMEDSQLDNLLKVLKLVHTKSNTDTAPIITALWDGIHIPEPTPERAKNRQELFLKFAAPSFHPDNRKAEQNVLRHEYTLYVPLEGRCGLGDAAAILETGDPSVLEKKLAAVESWETFPIHALAYALGRGVKFPPLEKPMNLEEMDALAVRLPRENGTVISLAIQAAESGLEGSWWELAWARGLLLAAVQSCSWIETKATVTSGDEVVEIPVLGEHPEAYYPLARAFGKVEYEFLRKYYNRDILSDEWILSLPPMHRFGWYCAQAFRALDSGNAGEYVRLLRKGLKACRDQKKMVDYLIENTPELQEAQTPQPSDELNTLAEKIRAILSNYEPDDPSVTLLKQSEAYQKVAYLIEGAAVPVMGRALQ